MVFKSNFEAAKKLPRHLRNEEIPTNILTPRPYQDELLDVALQENTIICLGTGTGKTFIAVMLVKELAHEIHPTLESGGGKKTVFLALSVPQVIEQAQVLQRYMNVSVGHFVPEMGVDCWTKENWEAELHKHNVVVMTAQIFLDILLHGRFALSCVNLLIFDECHHAVNNHPYKRIMHTIDKCPIEEHPHILGLTTCILNSSCKNPYDLEKKINDLEVTLHCKAATTGLILPDKYEHNDVVDGVRFCQSDPNLVITFSNDKTLGGIFRMFFGRNSRVAKIQPKLVTGTCPKEEVYYCASNDDSTGLISKISVHLLSVWSFLTDCNIITDDEDDEDNDTNPTNSPLIALCECMHILEVLGPWCASSIAQTLIKHLKKIEEQTCHVLSIAMLRLAATALKQVIEYVNEKFDDVYKVEDFVKYVTPKVVQLVDILRNFKPDDDFRIITDDILMNEGEDDESDISDSLSDISDDCDKIMPTNFSKPTHVVIKCGGAEIPQIKTHENLYDNDEDKKLCGLVFVERRHVAYALNRFLDELCAWDPDLCFVRCHYILGHGTTTSCNKESMMFRRQEEVLRKFRMQEYNLLITTNVLEEGVDVPKCNLVVRFDEPNSYRSYTQSKGRARAKDSLFAMLVVDSWEKEFTDNLGNFKGIDQVLFNRCQGRNSLTKEEIENNPPEDILPAYMPIEKEGYARVTICTAIALLNRYCAKLPSDTFTHLTPRCKVECITDESDEIPLYIAKLRLPINSPVKEEIWSVKPMERKRWAQMAAALKACELLHKAGELDDNLLPVGKEVVKYEGEDDMEEDEDDGDGQTQPGTTKRKQFFFKRPATALIHGHPLADEPSVLYQVHMVLTGPITDDQNTRGRKIYAPEESPRGFGILLSKTLPRVPNFPVYTRSGEVTMSLKCVSETIVVSAAEITRLHSFHKFVFSNVLRLEKDPMAFYPEKSCINYVLVPLLKDTSDVHRIDWSFIECLENYTPPMPDTDKQSKQAEFSFDIDRFKDTVVMPSYRNTDQPQYFYVAEIRTDLTPQSPFPSPDLYKTFKEYYFVKYGLPIVNVSHPLLDVDHTSARLNLLTPRYMNQKGIALPTSSADTKRARRENLQQKQILIPELCDVHVFPASLWRKAVCIPTILYRLNQLLVAEEMRAWISGMTSIGVHELPDDFNFPKLDFGFETSPDKLITESSSVNGASIESDSSVSKQIAESSIKNGAFVESSSTVEKLIMESNGKNSASIDSDSTVRRHNHVEEDSSTKTTVKTCAVVDEASLQKRQEVPSLLDCCNTALTKENIHTETSHIIYSSNSSSVLEQTSNLADNMNTTTLDSVPSNETLVVAKEGHLDANCDTTAAIPRYASANDLETNGAPIEHGWNSVIHTGDLLHKSGNEEMVTDCNQGNVQSSNDTNERPVVSVMKLSTNNVKKKVNSFSVGVWNLHSDDEEEEAKPKTPTKDHVTIYSIDLNLTPLVQLDEDMDLNTYIGPSPCTILQALTMSNANDFFSLERLETIGDSFLKYAITVYLYCSYPGIHEGKLSYLRSKQVSNCNLYYLGKRKGLPEVMISSKFEPNENWLPPGYIVSDSKKKVQGGPVHISHCGAKDESRKLGCLLIPVTQAEISNNDSILNDAQLKDVKSFQIDTFNKETEIKTKTEIKAQIGNRTNAKLEMSVPNSESPLDESDDAQQRLFYDELEEVSRHQADETGALQPGSCATLKQTVPYSLRTQHCIPDKSIADCIEALIGCYLTSCGKRAALIFMSWLGLHVLPKKSKSNENQEESADLGKLSDQFNNLTIPVSPLLAHVSNAEAICHHLIDGYSGFERKIGYTFQDKSYLLQAFTHASYHRNFVTDCYQRLEFLGDAILDYVITRHLFEDSRKYTPGVLTDLRSALVNNNIFAALAVRWDFHKFFKFLSPALFSVIEKFVKWQKDRNDKIDMDEEEEENSEGVKIEMEIPKALGDIFESVAGAIYLDSGMSLDTVWKVYYRIMKPQIDQYMECIPKSPVRELLELEPETAKFEKPERTLDGKIRVRVNVVGRGVYEGLGRNYRIAKTAAAKKALKRIKTMQAQGLV